MHLAMRLAMSVVLELLCLKRVPAVAGMVWKPRCARAQGASASSAPAREHPCLVDAGQGGAAASSPSTGTASKKKCAAGAAENLRVTVGPCTETREEHLKRHDGGRKTCPRCRYYLFGDAWTATYGSFASQSRDKTVWLDERPARRGGCWALGCSVCAQFELQRASTPCQQRASTPSEAGQTEAPKPVARRRRSYGVRGGTKFARHEVCHAAMGASRVRDHAQSEIHKLAVAAHRQPDKPVRILLQTTVDDEQLLAGAVPQPADWLRAWRVCMDPVSWAIAAHLAGTEHYIAQIRERSVKPRAIQSMVRCMTEALRIRKRKWLEEAKWMLLDALGFRR